MSILVVDPKQKSNSLKKMSEYIEKYQKIMKQKNPDQSNLNIQVLIKKANLYSSSSQWQYSTETEKNCQQTASLLQANLKNENFPEKKANIYSALIKIKQAQIQNGFKFSSQQFEQKYSNGDNGQLKQKSGKKYNQKAYEEKIKNCKQNYQQYIKLIKHSSQNNHFQLLRTRNNYADFLFKNNSYTEALTQSDLVLDHPVALMNTAGCFASLNIGKVSLVRGNCKHAFENLNRSYEILKQSLVKQSNQQKYLQVLLRSEAYRQIELMRVKTYNRQMRYDLAIKTLQFITPKNTPNHSNLSYLAQIHEQMGNTLALKHSSQQPEKYINCFEQAIAIRSKSNKKSLENGLSYCSIVKYLISSKNHNCSQIKVKAIKQKALKYLQQAKQIFTQYPSDHPNNWPLLLVMGQIDEKPAHIQKAIELVTLKHGQHHINTLRVRLHQCSIVSDCQKKQKLQSLKKDIQQAINKEKQDLKYLVSNNKKSQNNRDLIIPDQKEFILQKVVQKISKLKQMVQTQQLKSPQLKSQQIYVCQKVSNQSMVKLLQQSSSRSSQLSQRNTQKEVKIQGKGQSPKEFSQLSNEEKFRSSKELMENNQNLCIQENIAYNSDTKMPLRIFQGSEISDLGESS